MPPKTLRFTDIQTSNLLYFDPEFEKSCYDFCRVRDIDCLPSLSDPSKFYWCDETVGIFREEMIGQERTINGFENIFNPCMLERFREYPLLFVQTEGELTGVVHFSDYNRSIVDLYLFEMLSELEKALRKLLCMSGFSNANMLQYFEYLEAHNKDKDERNYYHRKIKGYEKKKAENEAISAFQCFYLQDLIELADHEQVISVDRQVNNLRNMIMHAHDLVLMKDVYTEDYIYSFQSFEAFFQGALALHQDLRRVNNRVAFRSRDNPETATA